jgi:uncharacterized membrane protein
MPYAEKLPSGYTMISQNRQQDIDSRPRRTTSGSMKAELEIEWLHEKIDRLR